MTQSRHASTVTTEQVPTRRNPAPRSARRLRIIRNEGRVLGGRYEVGERLGEGGTAVVYRAHDRVLDRDVAIKLLRDEHVGTIRARRFLSEAWLASRLQSPNTVRLFGFGEEDDAVYIVMELLEGLTLEAILGMGPQPIGFVMELLLQVGWALEEAHAEGIVHRDVKPQNILVLRRRGRPHFKLVDFSIARAFEVAENIRITRPGFVVGTPAYMAPEQVLGRPDLDGRTDLFSLGLIAIELLAGKRLFASAATERDLMRERAKHDLPLVRDLVPDIPDGLGAILDQMVARDRTVRMASTSAMLEDLVPLLGTSTCQPDIGPDRQPEAAVTRHEMSTVLSTRTALLPLEGAAAGDIPLRPTGALRTDVRPAPTSRRWLRLLGLLGLAAAAALAQWVL